MMKTAKASLSGLGFIEWARRTPHVVVTIVTPITTRKAGMFTRPTVKGGRPGAPQPCSRKPMTDGMAIIRPKPDAVATARWIGWP